MSSSADSSETRPPRLEVHLRKQPMVPRVRTLEGRKGVSFQGLSGCLEHGFGQRFVAKHQASAAILITQQLAKAPADAMRCF